MQEMQDRVIVLFNSLATRFGQNAVLCYIEERTEVAPIVTQEFITKKRAPSLGIQKKILGCLINVRPEDFPAERESLRAPVKAQVSEPVKAPRPEKKLTVNEQELRTIQENLRRKDVILKGIE